MTCDEFVRVLPQLEGGHNPDQNEHLRTCPACLELVADLQTIAREARVLAFDEDVPDPRIWKSIENTLRQEGLIREPQVAVTLRSRPGWRLGWLVPAFAALALVFGLLVYQTGGRHAQLAQRASVAAPVELASQSVPVTGQDEQAIVNLVAMRTPAMRDTFESNLRAVDTYIRDAESSARSHPDDAIAQQYLINAYEQRAMVYEMALNRSVP